MTTTPMTTKWRQCRARGHQWVHDKRRPAEMGGLAELMSKCSVCGVERISFITTMGSRAKNAKYRNYPDDYRLRKGQTKLTIKDWRKLVVKELLGD